MLSCRPAISGSAHAVGFFLFKKKNGEREICLNPPRVTANLEPGVRDMRIREDQRRSEEIARAASGTVRL
jgi:hypothetical protein